MRCQIWKNLDTSSAAYFGRTDSIGQGYRFYVDHLMEEKDHEISDMKEFVIEKTERMEFVLKQIAKMLAANTNYATVVSAPQTHHGKVKFIQLSAVDEEQVLATIMLDGNIVKNKIIRTEETPDQETMLKVKHSAEWKFKWSCP